MSEIQMIEMPAEKLPVLDEADVVVVGGGSSGFLAAVAAALYQEDLVRHD